MDGGCIDWDLTMCLQKLVNSQMTTDQKVNQASTEYQSSVDRE